MSQAKIVKEYADAERDALDTIRRYWKGRQALPGVIPTNAPNEVKTMARIARVNVCEIVVDSLTQSTFVDGFRAKKASENAKVWDVWQRNKMDKRQTGIHRAAYAYGASYAVVLPGTPVPVIRGASPRNMTAMYGEDPDWPMWALERLTGRAPDGSRLWRLYDDEAIYFLSEKDGDFTWVETREYGLDLPGAPVVRYLDQEDIDADDDVEPDHRQRAFGQYADIPMRGQVAPMMSLQDQIDFTTFGLLVAQHYSAFKQRYILGWVADDEAKKMKAAGSIVWTLPATDEDGNDVKVGELTETNLKGFIESRDATLRHGAALSQTPVHELTGSLINLSAEALVAAEKGRDRKADERQGTMGESHEQMLSLAGRMGGYRVPDDAQVKWRDTSARAFSATVDALGKAATLLHIPPQELWERIPGTTQQDVERWKKALKEGDAFRDLADTLERQANENGGVTVIPQ